MATRRTIDDLYVEATEAEIRAVREAMSAGDSIPAGFAVNFAWGDPIRKLKDAEKTEA